MDWLAVISLCLIPAARAATINVPANQPTIQAGINAASNGDTVLVAPGTYYENIDFKGKAITVTSSAGPATTILDGSSNGPAVSFKSSEPRAAVLSNFTIQHGGNFDNLQLPMIFSGGIYVYNASPTILNNVISLNNCWGIQTSLAAPLIQGNEISATQDPHGQCSFGGGAGIYIGGNLNSSQVTNNGSAPIILGNTIENNIESGIEDAGGNGGAAIAVWGGSPVVQNNTLRNNSSPGGSGGAINIVGGLGIAVVQNLIYGNSAGCGGGAIASQSSVDLRTGIAILVANNTFANNTGVSNAGYSECTSISQIYPFPDSYGMSSPASIFINNVISGSTSYPAVNCAWFHPQDLSYQPTFQNNILNNSGGPFFGSYCIDVSTQNSNITSDPQFVSPSTGDYHLKSTSPAIDAGQNSALQTFLTMTGRTLSTDFDGNPRVQNATALGCTVDMGAYEFPGALGVCGTSETLTSSLNPATLGQSVTLTAQLTAATGITTGTVQFLDGSNILSTQPVSGTGSSSFSTSSLAVGSHTITANYQPTGAFSATSAALTQVITGLSTAAAVTSSLNPAPYSQSVTFTATVTNTSSTSGAPTGTVTFTDGAMALGTQPLTASSTTAAAASFSTNGLSVGTHPITATYNPNSPYAGGSATLSQVITGTATTATLTSSLNPAPYGQPVTFTATIASASASPTGTVTFTDGTTITVTQPLTSSSGTSATASFTTSTLSVGSHTITATYSPTGGFTASTAALTETITGLSSSTNLTAAPNPAFFGQTVTLAAAVSGIPSTPTGSLAFLDGAATLATVPLDASGRAALTTSTLAVGVHTLTAVYAGSAIYSTSASAPFTEIINALPQDFAITLASPTITIRTQHHLTTTLTLTSLNGFADSLAVTCANLPTYVTCTPTPNPAPLTAGNSTTVSLYLDTDSVLGYVRTHPTPRPGNRSIAPIDLAVLFVPFALLAALSRRRTRLRLFLLLFALIPTTIALSGCGEIIYPYDPPPSAAPGTYTIPITATGAVSHLAHAASLTLQITP